MWIWEEQLRALGFRRKQDRYWQCINRFGLSATDHLSLFPWSVHVAGDQLILVELDTFHVTFLLDLDHIHFYYHEHHDNEWEPGGHTSSREIRRLQASPRELRQRADEIAHALVEALGGSLLPRRRRRKR